MQIVTGRMIHIHHHPIRHHPHPTKPSAGGMGLNGVVEHPDGRLEPRGQSEEAHAGEDVLRIG